MPGNKTTDFIAELVRAANEVHLLSLFERRRLLDRAIITIFDMREEVGIPSSHASADAIIHLQTTAFAIGVRTDKEVQDALLNAAEMIRNLRIMRKSVTKTNVRPKDDGGEE